jgi:hypothetical protein
MKKMNLTQHLCGISVALAADVSRPFDALNTSTL